MSISKTQSKVVPTKVVPKNNYDLFSLYYVQSEIFAKVK